jgi:LmbE family N-acetylglucosaminyl deacetylase
VRFKVLVTLLTLSCVGRTGGVDMLVISPHPDDEVLMAGGIMEQAVRRGERVAVVLVTNGDLSCRRDGNVRQVETVDALAAIGVSESSVRFLGYPDGHLAELTPSPLPPVERIGPDGRCGRFSTTWATRGRWGVDEHLHRTGTSASLTSTALTEDLASVMAELRPKHVYVSHGLDLHPDHAMTYVFFRRALDRLDVAPRRTHRSMIHAHGCWPADDCERPLQLEASLPPLPGGAVPDEGAAIDARLKLSLIRRYRSQLDRPLEQDWLSSFARTDEVFFSETYTRDGERWQPIRGDVGETEVFGAEGLLKDSSELKARSLEQ